MRHIAGTNCWIGHAGDAANFKLIFELSIRAIVQLAAEEPVLQTPRELVSLRFPLFDGVGNDLATVRLAVETISRLIADDIRTLISCSGGMSRSPAILAAAIAFHDRRHLTEALKRITEAGPSEVSPGLWNEIAALYAPPLDRSN
jgi:protein-tyrosine phosphatase